MSENIFSGLTHYEFWIGNPVSWLIIAFQIWMFVDAVRREEWIWAVFIFFGFGISAIVPVRKGPRNTTRANDVCQLIAARQSFEAGVAIGVDVGTRC